MEPRISLVTLAVEDVAASVRFYEGAFGWTPEVEQEKVAFYQLNGQAFGLFDRAEMAKDTGLTPKMVRAGGVALAHNVRSPDQVDELHAQAVAAGAHSGRDPEETFWGGYSGYVLDPDGHPWEIAYNPHWTVAEDGSVVLAPENGA